MINQYFVKNVNELWLAKFVEVLEVAHPVPVGFRQKLESNLLDSESYHPVKLRSVWW
jgi:hypothetical protein